MTFRWSATARAHLRAIPPAEAILILRKLATWADTGRGDVKPMQGSPGLFRLRVGKWRLIFDQDVPHSPFIHAVDNRGQIY